MNTAQLATTQDLVWSRWKQATDSDINWLKTTPVWVSLSEVVAPNNLVVRHRILQFLIVSRSLDNSFYSNIKQLNSSGCWVEGYSYYMYTRQFLEEVLPEVVEECDDFFKYTSYKGPDGKYWPAPFGDLRKGPLEVQPDKVIDVIKGCCLNKINYRYEVSPWPLGGNCHVPIERAVHNIQNGEIVTESGPTWRWYEGYEKKYTPVQQVVTLLNLKRWLGWFKRR